MSSVGGDDRDRYLRQTHFSSRAPAAFAGYQNERSGLGCRRCHQHRLQYTVSTDRLGQRVFVFGIELSPRLFQVGFDAVSRNRARITENIGNRVVRVTVMIFLRKSHRTVPTTNRIRQDYREKAFCPLAVRLSDGLVTNKKSEVPVGASVVGRTASGAPHSGSFYGSGQRAAGCGQAGRNHASRRRPGRTVCPRTWNNEIYPHYGLVIHTDAPVIHRPALWNYSARCARMASRSALS